MLTYLLLSSLLRSQHHQAATSTALKVSEQEVGATAPLGFFDPLGYITDDEKFTRYRAVERKHGRVAMMAMAGTFVHNNKWTFDGYLSPSNNLKFSDIDSGIGGLFQVPAAGLAQIILFMGFIELAWWPATQLDGDYGIRLGTINNWEKEPAKKIRQQNAELNNGRAAMMAIAGVITQEVLTGQNLAEQAAAGHWSPFGDGQGFF
jgi:light-harvesting complex I chlorophyll a/b binding protein 1